jgi:hypothetical protein
MRGNRGILFEQKGAKNNVQTEVGTEHTPSSFPKPNLENVQKCPFLNSNLDNVTNVSYLPQIEQRFFSQPELRNCSQMFLFQPELENFAQMVASNRKACNAAQSSLLKTWIQRDKEGGKTGETTSLFRTNLAPISMQESANVYERTKSCCNLVSPAPTQR